ncbi:MAG TPA: POTRA domain-containing protein, partial [Chitinophagaceae bacterium]|nr:POTRA domain-containing protein [Chitinophagaceae bacterium]
MKINEVNIAPNNNTWVHIREISFSGNTISKSHIVLRDMSIQPGDSILATDLDFELNYNKKRILNLQLFSTVKYKVTTIHPDTIDVEFQVTELFYWLTKPLFSLADRNLNVWWFEQNHRLDRTNIGLEFTRINFRGRNEKIGAIVQGGYNKHFELFYSNPYIDKHLKHGFGINVLYATGREINYITDSNKLYFYRSEHYPYQRFQAKLAYTYRNAYAAIHEVNLSYHFFNISKPLFDLSPVFLGPRRRINYFELNYIFKYNNTDIRLYPINGIEMKTILSKKG